MSPYSKPTFAAVHSDRESAICCFYFRSGDNAVATINALCGSGLPLTDPTYVYVPSAADAINAVKQIIHTPQ